MLRKVLFVAMALALLLACAKKEVKPQSEDSRLAQEAFALAENMRAAYVKKDFKGLAEYMTEEGYRSVSKRLRDFDKAEIEFRNRWVEIEGENVVLNVSWRGAWTVGGRERQARGMAVLELTGRPLKLNRVLQANPFMNPE